MKKILAGCLIVLLIGVVALGLAGLWAYRAAKPMIQSAGDYVAKARELASVGDRIRNKTPYSPPKDDELTKAQVERFIAVQARVRAQLGDRWSELQGRATALKKKADSSKGELSFGEVTSVFSEFTGIYMDARRAQVDALNVQKFSQAEYEWVRRRVYEAAGMQLTGGLDMSQIERAAREGAGSGGVQIPNIPMPEVPKANLDLVKPHITQLQESIALAFLGL